MVVVVVVVLLVKVVLPAVDAILSASLSLLRLDDIATLSSACFSMSSPMPGEDGESGSGQGKESNGVALFSCGCASIVDAASEKVDSRSQYWGPEMLMGKSEYSRETKEM